MKRRWTRVLFSALGGCLAFVGLLIFVVVVNLALRDPYDPLGESPRSQAISVITIMLVSIPIYILFDRAFQGKRKEKSN